MSDAELREAALAELDQATSHLTSMLYWLEATTVGYAKLKKPVPPASKWGQGLAQLTAAQQGIESARLAVEQIGADADDFVGICCYREDDFAAIADLGVGHIRLDRPDANAIADARAAGLEVLVGVWFNPWPDLNGGKGDRWPPLLAVHQNAWAKRMVDAWRGMGERPLALECWNEPWLPNFWQPCPQPEYYLELCRALAGEAWSVWPDMPILVCADTVGGGDTGQFEWRKQLLAADDAGFLTDPRIRPTTHNYCEARGPYAGTSKPCWWDFNRYECAYDDFSAHGHPDPQVWVTEYGWRSGDVLKGVPEAQQATFVTDAITMMRESGKVERCYAFLYKSNDNFWAYNWLRPDNTEKPVCNAIRSMKG